MPSCKHTQDPLNAYLEISREREFALYPKEELAWRPPPKIVIAKWADENRILQPGVSRQPGPWQTDTTPYLREVMNAYNEDNTRHIVLCFGTQLGKTESLYNTLGFVVDLEPYPTLLMYPTEDQAKEISRTRVQPMIEGCPVLKARKPYNRDLFMKLEMHFPGMTLFLVGANSAAALSQKPCRNIFRDEIDKYPLRLSRDADPLSLSEERTKSFWDIRKIFDVSSPTLETVGIWKQLQLCHVIKDYMVPCPFCNERQKLVFEQIKWETRGEGTFKINIAKNTAHYQCEHCKAPILDEHKPAMLLAGRWENETEPEFKVERIGFHLSSLYSPWLTWGDVVEQFLKANEAKKRGDKRPLQNFFNGWLALPWQEYEAERTEDQILALCDDRDEGIVPLHEPIVGLTAGVDVHDDGCYFVIRAWGEGSYMTSWLVRAGFIEDFEALERVLWGSLYRDRHNTEYIINFTFMDSGYRTNEVYEFCRGKNYIRATRGVQTMAKKYSLFEPDKYPGLKAVRINTTYYKDTLATKLKIALGDPGAFQLHKDVTIDYAKQMISEAPDDKGIWQVIQQRNNHFWDCEVLALAAADFAGARFAQASTSKPETKAKKETGRRGGRRW